MLWLYVCTYVYNTTIYGKNIEVSHPDGHASTYIMLISDWTRGPDWRYLVMDSWITLVLSHNYHKGLWKNYLTILSSGHGMVRGPTAIQSQACAEHVHVINL